MRAIVHEYNDDDHLERELLAQLRAELDKMNTEHDEAAGLNNPSAGKNAGLTQVYELLKTKSE